MNNIEKLADDRERAKAVIFRLRRLNSASLDTRGVDIIVDLCSEVRREAQYQSALAAWNRYEESDISDHDEIEEFGEWLRNRVGKFAVAALDPPRTQEPGGE